jgi:hypothetical protein
MTRLSVLVGLSVPVHTPLGQVPDEVRVLIPNPSPHDARSRDSAAQPLIAKNVRTDAEPRGGFGLGIDLVRR